MQKQLDSLKTTAEELKPDEEPNKVVGDILNNTTALSSDIDSKLKVKKFIKT